MNLAVHLPRICTGLALLALLSTAVIMGGPFFFGLVAVFAAVGQWEFYNLFWNGAEQRIPRCVATLLGALLIVAAGWQPELMLPGLGLAVLCLLSQFLFAWAADESTAFSRTAVLGAGLLYVPVLLLPALRFTPLEVAFLVGLTAASDTAAYFCGMHFGKHRVWPRVSPKKSVEGSLAGLLACVLFACIMTLTCGGTSLAVTMLVATGLGLLAQLGDFFESALKRSRNVKDSGVLLPGHGGVLDRADSLLFVIPAYACARAFWTFV